MRCLSCICTQIYTMSYFNDTISNTSEIKCNDLDGLVSPADTSGGITCLSQISIGDNFNNRLGRQIFNKSVHIHGMLAPQSSISGPSYVRLLVLYDKQCRGSLPVMTDIFTTSTTMSSFNLNNQERFIILMDLKYVCGEVYHAIGAYSYTNTNNTHLIDYTVNTNDIKTTYTGTNSLIASVGTGGIFLITLGNKASTTGAQFTINARLRFSNC